MLLSQIVLLVSFVATPTTDLKSVKAEGNPNRRAELALDYANETLDKAKALYSESEYEKSRAAVHEILDAAEVSYEAMRATGKDPRRYSKEFKRFEQRIQALIRRLRGFNLEVSVEDRPAIRKVEVRLEDIVDEIVSGIFKKAK